MNQSLTGRFKSTFPLQTFYLIASMDVLVTQTQENFTTQVYVKPTNTGQCLNGKSECPQCYKDSTIAAYIRRAIRHCSTWKETHEEIKRSTDLLLNNDFNNKDIEKQIKKTMDKWHCGKEEDIIDSSKIIKLYYKAHFSTSYKEDERIMRQLIKRNVTPTDPEKKISLTIYYRRKKTSHLLLRNSPAVDKQKTQQSHFVYIFTCKQGSCAALHSTYIGMTTMGLSRRLRYHLTAGAPKTHTEKEHKTKLTRKDIEDNTEVIATCNDCRRLPILEALHIKDLEPTLNIQQQDLQALPSTRKDTRATLSQSGAGTPRNTVAPGV